MLIQTEFFLGKSLEKIKDYNKALSVYKTVYNKAEKILGIDDFRVDTYKSSFDSLNKKLDFPKNIELSVDYSNF